MPTYLAIGPFQIILIITVFFLPWIIALIDIAKNDFKGQNKIIWLLIVLFTGILGAIGYFLIGRHYKITSNSNSSENRNLDIGRE